MRGISGALGILAAAIAALATVAGSSGAGPESAAAVHGIRLADMDPSVPACQDFNLHANGGWIKANPIPPDRAYWGVDSLLAEQTQEKLRGILDRASKRSNPPGSDDQKIGDFYSACMDEAAIEARGAAPLKAELAAIEGIATVDDLEAEIARLQLKGVNAVFQFGSEQDRRNAVETMAGAYQGGLSLPERGYYLNTDEASKKLRDQYVAHVARMFALLGDGPSKAGENAQEVLSFETALAQASMSPVEQRDVDKTDHRMTLAELDRLTPHFSWTAYLQRMGAPPLAAVNVGQPEFFQAVDRELNAERLAAWKNYLRWHLITTSAPSLSTAFVDEDFDFFGRTMRGTTENRARWKRCVSATDRLIGFALGKAYVRDYFPPEAKARVDAMVKNLIAALRADLATLPWLGEASRKAAIAKLDAFRPKIGYPDKWRDYSALTIDRGPYVLDVQRATEFENRRDLAKIGKPMDRTDWWMTPPTVDANYDPQKNELEFPAGILQPPFFDPQADDAYNYGDIGATIGHEMTHGFDDQGRKFDAQGNQRDWWTPDDVKNYEARARCVRDQYASYVFEGKNLNGDLVLGEAIADFGGLVIAYRAYVASRKGKPPAATIDGLTDDQRFFLSYAYTWAHNVRPELARIQMNTDPHALSEFRAIGPPSTMPEFAKAFGCKAGDPMVRKDLCQIW